MLRAAHNTHLYPFSVRVFRMRLAGINSSRGPSRLLTSDKEDADTKQD
jgi:hypothetical protein